MSRLAALESLAALVAAGNTDPDRLQVIAESIPAYDAEDTLRAYLILEPDPSDVCHGNPNEQAFVAAVRGWAGSAAFVDVLLDCAHVAAAWASDDPADVENARRRDDLLRLRDSWNRREDPEAHAAEVAEGRFRPQVPPPSSALADLLQAVPEAGRVAFLRAGLLAFLDATGREAGSTLRAVLAALGKPS